MPDYKKIIDAEMWAFIHKTQAAYPEDTATRTIEEQRAIYNAMCKEFYAGRPQNLNVRDDVLNGVASRIYGDNATTSIIYFHGGGFVVGGLNSHDDVCAEIALYSNTQVIAADYRLSPENKHPAAFNDAMSISEWALEQGDVILVGDSAGGNLAAAVSGALGERIKGQVLIYPALGGDINKGSYIDHANAPMLSREEVLFYLDIRGGSNDDPTLHPLLGALNNIAPTYVFSAECDPLHDDGAEYTKRIVDYGGAAQFVSQKGLVHGWLRARHESARAASAFRQVCGAISFLSQNDLTV